MKEPNYQATIQVPAISNLDLKELGLDQDQSFYISDQGQLVIVFDSMSETNAWLPISSAAERYR